MVQAHIPYRTAQDCDLIQKTIPTMERCNLVHSTIKKQLAVLTTFLCIMVTGMGWSVYAAYTSESLAKEATSQLQIYQAKQDGVERLMQSSLSRIEKTTIDLHTEIKEQRNMIEDIYKGKINHAP